MGDFIIPKEDIEMEEMKEKTRVLEGEVLKLKERERVKEDYLKAKDEKFRLSKFGKFIDKANKFIDKATEKQKKKPEKKGKKKSNKEFFTADFFGGSPFDKPKKKSKKKQKDNFDDMFKF